MEIGPFNLRPLPRRGLGEVERGEGEAGRVARAKEKAERLALRNTRRNAERAARRKAGEEAERLAKARRNAPPRRTQVPFLYSFFQLLFLGGMRMGDVHRATSQGLVARTCRPQNSWRCCFPDRRRCVCCVVVFYFLCLNLRVFHVSLSNHFDFL